MQTANGKRQFVPRDRVFTYHIVASCSSNTYLFMHVIHNSFAQFMIVHFLTWQKFLCQLERDSQSTLIEKNIYIS